VELLDSKLLLFLRQTQQTIQECRLSARLTGESFNVFTILGLRTAEVRTHSAFIAELLNPRGAHGQDTTYLRLFLKELKIDRDRFDPTGASVQVEYPIGPVDKEGCNGGRIDIVLTDARNCRILIENKIYAGDGDNQLLRYHNFSPDAVLIYLTPDGHPPSETSTGGKAIEVERVSYGKQILQWLEDCHKASVSLPVVRETIQQYKYLIRELTHQATGDKMKEKAIKLLLNNKDVADAVVLLGEAWQSILDSVKNDFYEQTKNIQKDFPLRNGVTIQRWNPEDMPGLAVAFRAHQKDKPNEPAVEAETYSTIFRKIPKSQGPNNWWNIGWVTPDALLDASGFVENLPAQKVLSLYENKAELTEFALEVERQAQHVTDELLAKINALQDKRVH